MEESAAKGEPYDLSFGNKAILSNDEYFTVISGIVSSALLMIAEMLSNKT